MRFAHLVSIAVAIAPGIAIAQTPTVTDTALHTGSRVRVTSIALGTQRVVGTLVSATSDSVIFTPVGVVSAMSLKTVDVKRLEVSRGRNRHLWKGPLIGFLVGAGLTAGYAAATWDKNNTNFIDFGRWGDAGLAAIPGGLVGLLVGSIFGAREVESWKTVPLPRA